MDVTVVLMLKTPRPGLVKSRLAAHIGAEAACEAFRKMVEGLCEELRKCSINVEVHFTPDDAVEEMCAWLGDHFTYYPQTDGDLGIRLTNATESAFERGAQSVILLGGDCPYIDAALISECTSSLKIPDSIVIGPAKDGGYYLLGITAKNEPELFTNIDWSTDKVLEQTVQKAKTLGKSIQYLTPLEDIDDISALNRWQAGIANR